MLQSYLQCQVFHVSQGWRSAGALSRERFKSWTCLFPMYRLSESSIAAPPYNRFMGFTISKAWLSLMRGCPVGELVSEGENFPKLEVLELCHMYNLNIICGDSVIFPSRSEFSLSRCPKLKKLPRGLMNDYSSLETCVIRGEQKRLDGLSWKDYEFKSFLFPRDENRCFLPT